MKVLLLGDLHGNLQWAARAAGDAKERGIDVIVQVGDLGVWPGESAQKRFDELDALLESLQITMLVAPGNHEDYDQIEALQPRSDGWLEYRKNILLAPRGLRTTLGTRSVLWCGGAGSVDRAWRQARDEQARAQNLGAQGASSWWPQEALTDQDVQGASSGGYADIMVCHDAPDRVAAIDSAIIGNPMGFEWRDLTYAAESRTKLTKVVDAVQPQMLLHGHFHFPVDDVYRHADGKTQTRIVGLAAEDDPCSSAVLDLYDLSVKFLHLPERHR